MLDNYFSGLALRGAKTNSLNTETVILSALI
ncbi:MAG: hypothetical protein ACI9EW_003313, partial [Cellvibrionaceae bacterium]